MKRHTIWFLCGAAALAAACSEEPATTDGNGLTGTLAMHVSTRSVGTDTGDYDPLEHLSVRIYNNEGGLLRKYDSEGGIPERLELLAGRYRVAVEAGDSLPASFRERFYKGAEEFSVTAGAVTPAEVVCKQVNATVEVKFDESVRENFGEDFHALIAAAESIDEESAAAGTVPTLRYTSDATGYICLPEGVTTLAWNFRGEHPGRGTIENTGSLDRVKAGGRYVLTFKFSPDLPGYIGCFPLRVDDSTDDYDDTIVWSPDPTVEGVGFDMDQTQDYIPGKTAPKSYKIAAMAVVERLTLRIGGEEIDALDGGEGIAVSREDDRNLTLTLSEEFFARFPGGEQTLDIRVRDAAASDFTARSPYRLQGVLAVDEADCNLWSNTATLRMLVLDPAVTEVTFSLREEGGTWCSEVAATRGDDGLFTAAIGPEWTTESNAAGLSVYAPAAGTGVFAANRYECRATASGRQYTLRFATAAGQSIPAGNMEDGTQNCFDNDHGSFWDSGNNSMSDPLCVHYKFGDTGIRGEGSYCARLVASKPIAIVKLAAGNLFTGEFYRASAFATDATVRFGAEYVWQARPKALHVLCHASLGTVDQTQHLAANPDIPLKEGDPDQARIYVAIVDWDTRHEVVSGSSAPKGTWDPATVSSTDDGAIVGYGSAFIGMDEIAIDGKAPFEPGFGQGETMLPLELPIRWYDTAIRPGKRYGLVISASTSAYGDYMVGSTQSEMYVDDFKWVY